MKCGLSVARRLSRGSAGLLGYLNELAFRQQSSDTFSTSGFRATKMEARRPDRVHFGSQIIGMLEAALAYRLAIISVSCFVAIPIGRSSGMPAQVSRVVSRSP